MKAIIYIFSIIVLYSCNSKNHSDYLECINQTGVNNSLYKIILSYQEANPIPNIKKSIKDLPPSPETAFKYIYEVQFVSGEEDIVVITLKADGITQDATSLKNNVYGVFQDSCLKPTYFISNDRFSNLFLGDRKKGNLNNFIYDNSSIIDILYVRYVYKLIKGRFYFKEKIFGNIGK